MGQQEVYQFLCEHPGQWYTSREISNAMDMGYVLVAIALKKLRDGNFIIHQKTKRKNEYRYKLKTYDN